MDMYTEQDTGLVLTESGASHFARIALDCIHKEYPNKLNQTLPSGDFLKSPRELHPAFYGCFDWHSSVHGHWMLVKLLTMFPELPERDEIVAGLTTSLSADNILGEVAYFDHESGSWERTYGWAWLLQLAMELHEWDDPLGRDLAANLEPLTQVMRDKYIDFLPRQYYPVRTFKNVLSDLKIAVRHPKFLKVKQSRRAVQQPKHYSFAVQHWNYGNTNVYFTICNSNGYATVLRLAFLSNVEFT